MGTRLQAVGPSEGSPASLTMNVRCEYTVLTSRDRYARNFVAFGQQPEKHEEVDRQHRDRPEREDEHHDDGQQTATLITRRERGERPLRGIGLVAGDDPYGPYAG
jgi:hypothetical protein